MERRKVHKVLAVALAVALPLAAIGNTVAIEQQANQEVLTGHSTFLSTSTTFNSCFAGVAGLLMQRVTWFNGQTLFQRSTDGGGNTWVYLTEGFRDGPDGDGYDEDTGIKIADPAKEQLFKTDKTYTFEVPGESKTWTVKEYFALRDQKLPDEAQVGGDGEVDGDPKRVYVFAVKVADQEFELKNTTIGNDYNFVSVVDTCRFHGSASDPHVEHDNGREDDSGYPVDQHESQNADGKTHNHTAYTVDVWVGGPPQAVPGTEETGGVPDDRDNSSSTKEDAENGQP